MKKKLLAILLVVVLALSSLVMLVGCSQEKALVVGYSAFSSKFSAFFAKTAYDQDVATMTGVNLLANTRAGNIVLKGINGEKESYNGIEYTYTGPADFTIDKKTDETVYTIQLREDLVFSDGTPVTIDDVIFSMYVLCDPTYTGSSTLYSQPIKGMIEYRTGFASAIYEKYGSHMKSILRAGRSHVWTEEDSWPEDLQEKFWTKTDELWITVTDELVDYIWGAYAANYAAAYGLDPENEAHKAALTMVLWGFGSFDWDGIEGTADDDLLEAAYTHKQWTMVGDDVPTNQDIIDLTKLKYKDNIADYEVTENESAYFEEWKTETIAEYASNDPDYDPDAVYNNISGIVKTGQYSMTVTTDGFDATTIYHLGVTIAPLHYYGDTTKYDYANNKFGFDKGDLSTVTAKTTQPMGAGPYKFDKFENGIVYFVANDLYYKGAPKIKYVRFKETSDPMKISGVVSGDLDISDPSVSDAAVGQIKEANPNGELSGDVIETSLVDNLGYGYIGINSKNVKIGEPDSRASKDYRKGIATLLAVYRDVVINSYYGDRAVVIQYPISNTSWAAPSPADTGYKTAYSLDPDGKQIYTTTMTAAEKYEAAKDTAIAYFKRAGFTFNETTGKFTAAPAGASLSLTMDIPGEGVGDHPSFAIFTYFSEAMEELGFTINIIDYANTAAFWEKLEANNMQIWAAAWGATIDPDMYQVYHSSNGIGLGGTDSNHYNIDDATLDEKIMDARTNDDNSYRKGVYKECLEIIMDWAVEIPTYQRKNGIIFSAKRLDLETLTPDITTFWGWMSEIEKLELAD